MNKTKGKVVGINGNMISVSFEGLVTRNEGGYGEVGSKKLKSEVTGGK